MRLDWSSSEALSALPQTFARPTSETPKTHIPRPSQLKAYIFLFRKTMERMAAKTMDEPRSICQTLAGM